MERNENRLLTARVTEYVLSTNACAATGIVQLLSHSGKTSMRLEDDSTLNMISAIQTSPFWRVTVVMPADPLSLLKLTSRLAHFVRHNVSPPWVVILTPAPVEWQILTLAALGCPPGMLSNITVIPVRTSCAELEEVLSRTNGSRAFLKQTTFKTITSQVLTPAEYQAVTDWLSGYSAHACAINTGRSVKTIYGLRSKGLNKLACIFPVFKTLSRRFYAVDKALPSSAVTH